MKYSKMTADLEKAFDIIMSGNTQGLDAQALAKVANIQIAAWRERRCDYKARDERPPAGEFDM